MTRNRSLFIWLVPLAAFSLAFLALPLVRLFASSVSGPDGFAIYRAVLTNPRYLNTLWNTFVISAAVTFAALAIATTAGLFLARHDFFGRNALISLMTFPLAFPGVVVGFLIILLGGRQGLMNDISRELTGMRLVFAYSSFGLFLGYLYFSIPRVILTIMAAAEKIDPHLEEAARSLGASSLRIAFDILLPALMPALIASGAVVFATAMGAFGTAFTLATDIDVLPMVIYTEFTLSANIAMAAALSVMLGSVTWVSLLVARHFASGPMVAAG
ncbi:ABC transporter permease [Allorhizobium sp. BGMRC 0089]|uniref:ABC transporter permease n=1 Tax=Allorhizobium sonneratiae TaxID=2934936 RepID=UPI00203479F8|nr:ABC transporter permease [Allorhizobium sonneratiae]MCM2293093.1 ABC transporter permease [Allorhizobium sonneratiae]